MTTEMAGAARLFANKRILHVIGDSKFGGDAVYMFSLARMFRDFGGEPYVCTTTKETIALAEQFKIPVFDGPLIKRDISPFADTVALIQLVLLCRKYRFDYVHTHTSKGGAIGRIGARLAGVKYVIHTIHGFAFHEFTPRSRKLLFETIEKVAAMFCDLAISVNDEDRLTAIDRKIIPHKKIMTIKNGVPPDRFSRDVDLIAFRKTLGIKENAVIVGTVSRFAEQKDPETFIRAAERLLRSRDDLVFIYVGDGPLYDSSNELIDSLGLREHFLTPGFVTNPIDYLKLFDIFVTTALYEGLPIALLEAMAIGVPSVVTDVKGNRECVDGNVALVVPARSPEAVSHAVIELIDSPTERSNLGSAAKLKFAREFSEQRMLDQTLDAYVKLSSKM